MLAAAFRRRVLYRLLAAAAALATFSCSSSPAPQTPGAGPAGTTGGDGDGQQVVVPSDLPPAPTSTPTSAPLKPAPPQPRPIAAVQPFVLPAPPFDHRVVRPVAVKDSPAPALRQLRMTRNNITDDEAWFTRNGLPQRNFRRGGDNMPADVPVQLGRFTFVQGFLHSDHRVLVYGRNRLDGFLVALQRLDGHTLAVFDLSRFARSPRTIPGDERFVAQSVRWAKQRDGVLYIANGHNTYAKSSFNKNGYINAIDVKTGELMWRSAPLVNNARSVVITASHIVAGYGFTAEADYLYLLSRRDGKTLRRIPINSGPSEIIEKDGKLHVRCYDTDYVFSL